MLISMNWISDFVDLTGLDKMALIRQFSLSTAEVENEIFHKGADLSGVVAAQIVSVENHPESHKLHLLKVDAGDGQLTDVVCGAPNVQLGMKTAFAKVGAQLATSPSARASSPGTRPTACAARRRKSASATTIPASWSSRRMFPAART